MKHIINKLLVITLLVFIFFSFINTLEIKASHIADIPTLEMKGGQTSIEGENSIVDKEKEELWEELFFKYRELITGGLAVATLTMILFFISNLVRVAASATNPSAREKGKTSLFITGIATMGLGALTLITAMLYNFF